MKTATDVVVEFLSGRLYRPMIRHVVEIPAGKTGPTIPRSSNGGGLVVNRQLDVAKS
jgi:hypothetical protein